MEFSTFTRLVEVVLYGFFVLTVGGWVFFTLTPSPSDVLSLPLPVVVAAAAALLAVPGEYAASRYLRS